MSWVLLVLAGLPVATAGDLSIPYEKYELDNGLTVILAEDHDIPIVQVNVWYHVGSGDEVDGRTGFAHLFEHLMFQGSAHNDQDYFGPLQEVGGRVNGTTNVDRTNYFEGVPAEYLPLALWGEADRMGWLLPALTQEKLDNQRDVVKNERRQRYENQPYGTHWITLLENVFPTGHPYHHPTIGSHEDLQAASLEDVKAFFTTWYVPNNASLVIAGDFDPAKAKELVELYFGEIPAGPDPVHKGVPEFEVAEETVIKQVEEGVPYPKIWIAWKSPALFEPGDAELDLLSQALSEGKDSRLYSKLVLEDQIAKSVDAYQVSMMHDSMYVIEASALPGTTTDDLVAAIDAILAETLESGITAEELSVGLTQYETGQVWGLQRISSKADTLNRYNYMAGEPDYLSQNMDRYRQATVEGVGDAANAVLGAPGRFVLHINPPAEGGE